MDRVRKSWPFVVFGLLGAAALILHARMFLPFISDDALISLRYAERLMTGHGLTWTDGPRVEGYTNLLWVLGCAGLGAVGVDLVDAARLLGFVGMIAAMFAVGWSAKPRSWRESIGSAAGLGIVAATPAFAVWAIGGLEQPLIAAFWAWALVLVLRLVEEGRTRFADALVPSALLGLLCLSRADSAILCVGLAVGFAMGRGFDRGAWRFIAGLAVFPILLGGAQMIFRRFYYDEWLPNSALVKVAFTTKRIEDGWTYYSGGLPFLAGLLIPSAAAAIFGWMRREGRSRVMILLVPVVAWSVYVVFIGGDIFPARRHFIPILIPLAILAAHFANDLAGRSGRWAGGVWIGVVVIIAAVAFGEWRDPATRDAINERWEWDGKAVAVLLRDAFGDRQPLLACDAAGCLPFFSKLPCIDMLGLNDYHIARRRTSRFGYANLGHELGDGKYVMERQPDIVILSLPTGSQVACFVSGQEMMADPRFNELYRFVVLQTSLPHVILAGAFIRVGSEKIGVRQSPGRIEVPGFFAATEPATAARLDSEGRFGAVTTPKEFARLRGLSLPPGEWEAIVESDQPVQMIAVRTDRPEIIAQGTGSALLRVAPGQPIPIELELRPAGTTDAHIRRLVFSQKGRRRAN